MVNHGNVRGTATILRNVNGTKRYVGVWGGYEDYKNVGMKRVFGALRFVYRFTAEGQNAYVVRRNPSKVEDGFFEIYEDEME